MTNRSANKTAARRLQSLTSAPYQSCLTAVDVLRHLPGDTSLGDLESVLLEDGPPGKRVVATGTQRIADDIRKGWGTPDRCWLDDRDDVVIAEIPRYSEHEVLIPLQPPDILLPSGVTLFVEVGDDELHTRPGVWAVDAATFKREVRRAPTNDHQWELLGRRVEAHPFPHRHDAIEDTYLTDALTDVDPRRRSPGPGFDWLHLAFDDLGLTLPDGETPHDEANCPDPRGSCGILHNWPAADPDRTELIVPEPLLLAWRQLVQAHGSPEFPDNESQSYRHNGSADSASIYGLDLPWISQLWLYVDPHPDELAAPSGRTDEHTDRAHGRPAGLRRR